MSDPITRLNAALEGRYRIERELGEGGMATVYLADDVKHERKVALKVLKPELAAVVGAERFLAEIKTTANLQHPHILPLFDSGEADGFLFYVMPYVEGESLRERLDREKQLGVDDALALTAKLCDALDYAHSEGVIHRDIKPANILLSKRGEPLVADFGIALAVAHAGGGRITETGLSLGTPHYMSPEQATGDSEVDPRSDVYALACVVYEMLAGEPPFSASTTPAILAKILTMDAPSITMVRRTVPQNVSAALAKALEKLPADRFTTVAEFGAALADLGFSYAARARATTGAESNRAARTPARPTPWMRDVRSVAALGVGLVVSAFAAWGWLASPETPEPGVVTRTVLPTPGAAHWVAVSPDGRWLMTMLEDGGLRVREAADPEWRRLPNVGRVSRSRASVFSPDGAWVLIQGDEDLLRVPTSGGPAQPLSDSWHGDWGDEDMIVYGLGGSGSVYRVAALGGEPELLFSSDSLSFRSSRLLPGGRGVLLTTAVSGDRLSSRLLVYDAESGEIRELLVAVTDAQYVSTGHLIYSHASGALMGVPFDLQSLRVTGSPVTLVSELALSAVGLGRFSISETGTLIYGVDRSEEQDALVWLEEGGRDVAVPIEPPTAANPAVSPDGASIAYEGDRQIWIHDIARGTDRQFTFGAADAHPIWSPDGRYLYFVSEAGDGRTGVMRRVVDGSSEPEAVLEIADIQALTSMSPDGRWLVYQELGAGRDIMLLDLEAEAGTPPVPYMRTDAQEIEGTVSPDGRYLAYLAGGSIFVRGFPEPSGLWRVADGREPVWAPDGRALFFSGFGGVQRVDIETEPSFSVGSPYDVVPGVVLQGGAGISWDAHPDGDRFVASRPSVRGTGDVTFYIVTNWFTELRQLMGEGN
jgi:serine/threonine-protein kinase